MINENEFIKDLTATKALSPAEINKFSKEAQSKNSTLLDYLLEDKIIDEKETFKKIAEIKSIPFIDLANETIRKDILQFVPEPIAQSHNVVAFDKKGESLRVATLDPTDLQTFAFLEKKIQMPLEIFYTTPSSIANVLKQYHRSLKAEFEKITRRESGESGEKEKLQEMAEDLPIIRVVDTLLEYAIFEGASDIHIEPEEKEVVIRYRVDGLLREVMTLPKKVHLGLVARIKILSNLKLDEHRLPQDGRFKVETDDYKISFRVSVIPVFDGEKIVMRLLNESTKILTLEQLGFQDTALAAIKRNINKPNGMLLVTGPTGSGKTTTLYTILNMVNKPGVNITTIEDPIEYRMPGVNQSQVNPKIGYTFASGLRAFLRQDP
ncbi:MAG TPA: ATPase, T2SS/T4P/T4SS family, partial [Patescibacteria group bacterium]|nr:ATPase, T2SS/T4P/T4SS family [Patescibacteria group bacterium]